ncbi:protein kinase domain-containing protein [Sporothrix brasiliensis 5110]|uniref:Protein kinase domain-containing protein n=1 Tax=Sporothrix brasiliensis 5110 TaxID=1398154 RepID=A0A0C2F767_9PEZI|nr:protein kinase domain-containing protein [Sporothrix brasiliensis 5110]KIH94804.1 protein kinase domain-containing protein [Sporothrix brasiliensis 5110]
MTAETDASLPWVIDVPRFAYKHSKSWGALGYSLQFVAIRQRDQKRWHVRVVVECRLLPTQTTRERVVALKELCHAIDFGTLDLLDDTLTEVFIHVEDPCQDSGGCPFVYRSLPDGNPFNPDDAAVVVETCEDPTRFLFPVLNGNTATTTSTRPTTRRVTWDHLQVVEDSLALATHTVRLFGEEQLYVLKSIDRGIYIPQDTPALESELHVLERVGGRDHIARLVAVVVSENPYSSTPTRTTDTVDTVDTTDLVNGASQTTHYTVLRGLLLEYYPGGTLETVLKTKSDTERPWVRWASQLCTAVAAMHVHNFTHMDIKTSNMVIDDKDNLVLIDVGGAGGYTRGWLSPHMESLEKHGEPLDAPLADRKENDMWAVGKTLLLMATGDEKHGQAVQAEARKFMADPPLVTLHQTAAALEHLPEQETK